MALDDTLEGSPPIGEIEAEAEVGTRVQLLRKEGVLIGAGGPGRKMRGIIRPEQQRVITSCISTIYSIVLWRVGGFRPT